MCYAGRSPPGGDGRRGRRRMPPEASGRRGGSAGGPRAAVDAGNPAVRYPGAVRRRPPPRGTRLRDPRPGPRGRSRSTGTPETALSVEANRSATPMWCVTSMQGVGAPWCCRMRLRRTSPKAMSWRFTPVSIALPSGPVTVRKGCGSKPPKAPGASDPSPANTWNDAVAGPVRGSCGRRAAGARSRATRGGTPAARRPSRPTAAAPARSVRVAGIDKTAIRLPAFAAGRAAPRIDPVRDSPSRHATRRFPSAGVQERPQESDCDCRIASSVANAPGAPTTRLRRRDGGGPGGRRASPADEPPARRPAHAFHTGDTMNRTNAHRLRAHLGTSPSGRAVPRDSRRRPLGELGASRGFQRGGAPVPRQHRVLLPRRIRR